MRRVIGTSRFASLALGLLVTVLLATGSAEPPPVKLGVLTDLSGVYSDAAGTGSVMAVRTTSEDCLAAECRGMRIEIVSADHQNKADVALATARAWVDTGGVRLTVRK